MTKVVSIQYPSGGFGHFIHIILSSYGEKFAGKIKDYEFGPGGDSHSYPLFLPKYLNSSYDQKKYKSALQNISNEFVTVLVDSGIDNDSDEFKHIINPDYTLRICYDDWSWPLLAKMFYTRCMASITNQSQHISRWIMPSEDNWSDPSADYAKREKFFLYLRDHSFRKAWRVDCNSSLNLPVENIFDYNILYANLNQLFPINNFNEFYSKWFTKNYEHFEFYFTALDIINNINQNKDISGVNDLFTQAVVYYYIWLKYNFEVPHNDFSNWFTTTNDIAKMLKDYGVAVDTF